MSLKIGARLFHNIINFNNPMAPKFNLYSSYSLILYVIYYSELSWQMGVKSSFWPKAGLWKPKKKFSIIHQETNFSAKTDFYCFPNTICPWLIQRCYCYRKLCKLWILNIKIKIQNIKYKIKWGKIEKIE